MTTTPHALASPRRRGPPEPGLDDAQYRKLAAFRYALRRYLRFSEAQAQELGLTAQHYQALLALRAQAGSDEETTISALAGLLLIRHHSAVGLVDRLAAQGLLARAPAHDSRRKVALRLTAKGSRILGRLAQAHRDELEHAAHELTALLQTITEDMAR